MWVALALAMLGAMASASTEAEEMPTEGLTTTGATPLAGDGTNGTQLRAFCTDRPTKANLPCMLDEGHWHSTPAMLPWPGGFPVTSSWMSEPT